MLLLFLGHLRVASLTPISSDALDGPTFLRPYDHVMTDLVFAPLSDPHRLAFKPYAMSTTKKGCLWSLIRLYDRQFCLADAESVTRSPTSTGH